MKQALQNAKDRKLAKGNPLAALKVDHRANRASNDSQSSTNMNDELIDGSNTDTIIGVENTNNTAIAAENMDNDAMNAENTDNDVINAENTDNAINADNTSNAETDGEKSDDAAMSNNNTDEATTGDGNTENTTTGETSTVEVPSPLHYGRKTKDPSKVKTSKKCTPILVEPSIDDPLPDEMLQ